MAILEAISNFMFQMAEPFRVLYMTIVSYVGILWQSLTVFQKIFFALVLYLPVLYLIVKTLRNIQDEKERRFLNYLLMVDIPEGQTCDTIEKTNGKELVSWDGNSAELNDLVGSATMTYSFWLKVNPANFYKNNYQGPRCILAKGTVDNNGNIVNPAPAFWILNDNFTSRLWCLVYTQGGPTNGEGILLEEFPLNELFQLCMVIDGRSMNIYLNGELVRTTVLSGPLVNNNSNLVKAPLQIDGPPENKGFLGCMNLLRVSKDAYTPVQIRKFYLNEKLYLDKKMSGYDLTGKMNEECACPSNK